MTSSTLGGRSLIASMRTRKVRDQLNDLILRARDHVPMYRQLYATAGVVQCTQSITDTLNSLPILSKSDLLAHSPEERIDERTDPASLRIESTTGSTGQPFSVYLDKAYIRERNIRFLRGLWSLGYRPWHRIMLLTDRHKSPKRVAFNRYYVPVEQSNDAIVEAFERIRPHVLYGFLAPLRQLADELPTTAPRPRLVFSTAEMLDPMTRRQLRKTFGCSVSDLYGMTEMGLVAWQKAAEIGYVMVSDSIIVELIPVQNSSGRYRVVMTNLALKTSPLIRYDSGDVAQVKLLEGTPTIVAIEGRLIDTLVRTDGAQISPYRVTDALGEIHGLKRFKITQESLTQLTVTLVVERDHRTTIEAAVQTTLQRLLGSKPTIHMRICDAIFTDASSKFRPVESHVARP